MTICEMCKREFVATTVKYGEKRCHADGKYYADCSWHGNFTCPRCGHDNTRVSMEAQ
jgi:transcription elongation factor Elf1